MWKYIVETKAPREAVWRIWEDVPGWTQRARLDSPFEDGTRGGLKLRGPIGALCARVAPRFALEEVLPGESFTLSRWIPFGRTRNHHELAETGVGRRHITHRMKIFGPLEAPGSSTGFPTTSLHGDQAPLGQVFRATQNGK